jgi:hypothetical protein
MLARANHPIWRGNLQMSHTWSNDDLQYVKWWDRFLPGGRMTRDPITTDSVGSSVLSPPNSPQTFATAADRSRLTPAALEALRNLARAWKLSSQEAADLLAVSVSTWDRIRADAWKQTLSQDQFMRVSAMVGIFKGLHLLFVDDMADRWVRLRNSGPLFQNRTPIEAMHEGGIPAMLEIRRHVDALRGGL